MSEYVVIGRHCLQLFDQLQINSSLKEQWKLLLEQKSIGYVYPCEVPSKDRKQSDVSTAECDDWQIVVPLNDGVDDNGKKESKDTESVAETDGNENYGESKSVKFLENLQ